MSLSRSQFAITMQTKGIKGGRSYLPYVYAEQGIIALAGVLRSGLADKMAMLFDRDRSVISRHISNIFNEGEASKDTSVHFLQISGNAANHRPPQLYNLDVIISVFIGQKSIESLSEVMRATRIVDQKSNSNDNIDHFHFCGLHFGY